MLYKYLISRGLRISFDLLVYVVMWFVGLGIGNLESIVSVVLIYVFWNINLKIKNY